MANVLNWFDACNGAATEGLQPQQASSSRGLCLQPIAEEEVDGNGVADGDVVDVAAGW